MVDSEAFLTDIRAAPDDDVPRLVYADWLEEKGEPTRAELIRVQCELSNLAWHSKRHQILENRELALLRKHKNEWLGNLSTMVRSARFERGCIERIALGAKQFSQYAEDIFARAPVRKVSLLQVSDHTAPEVASTEALSRVQELLIHGNRMTNLGWQSLLTSKHLRGTTSLEFSVDFESGRTTPSNLLSSLAKCPSLPKLTELRTSYLHLDDHDAQSAFQALAMPSLRSLTLPYTRADTLQMISAGPLLRHLFKLDLTGNHLHRNPLLKELGSSARELRTLRVDSSGLFDQDVLDLFGDNRFDKLEELDIRSNYYSDQGLVRILTQLRGLKRLIADQIRLEGTELRALWDAEWVSPLEELSISNASRLTKSDIAILAGSLRPTKLSLCRCNLTDSVSEPLMQTSNTEQLLWLDLGCNMLTDKTARSILDSPHLHGLRRLSLRENDISSDLKKALRTKYGPGVCAFSR